jgi:hypothetical protein
MAPSGSDLQKVNCQFNYRREQDLKQQEIFLNLVRLFKIPDFLPSRIICRYRFPLSRQRFKVRAYDLLNSAHACELHELFGSKALLLAVEFKRLNGRVEADLISILEAIGDCLLWAIDANWDAVYFVCLDSMGKSLP